MSSFVTLHLIPLRQGLSLNWKLTISPRLALHSGPGIDQSPVHNVGVTVSVHAWHFACL